MKYKLLDLYGKALPDIVFHTSVLILKNEPKVCRYKYFNVDPLIPTCNHVDTDSESIYFNCSDLFILNQ